MRKNLQHIQIKKSEIQSPKTEDFLTYEGIPLKTTYSEQDIEHLEHLDFGAGFAPNLRGIHTTMYVQEPWRIQKKNEATIDSVEEIKIWINQFSAHELSVLRTTTDTILPIIAFYILAAEELDLQPEQLSGIIQNDISKELTCTKSYRNSLKISTDILEYTSKKMPKFNPICISSCSIQEAGASADMELAYTLTHAAEIIKTGLAREIKIDELASRLSFCFSIGMNHFMEIAKMRAARMIWAKLMIQFHPKDNKSLDLHIHSQTKVRAFDSQNSSNNLTRTCIEGSSAVFGGTQSLQTTFEGNTNFSADSSARIARNTQLYLQKETKITKTIDPWAGSFYVENLTHEIAQKTWKHIAEIEKIGGMTKAIDAKILKLNLKEKTIQPKNTNNQKLEKIKASRDPEKVQFSLEKLATCIQTNEGNLLEFTIEAARNRATFDEIRTVLETIKP